VQRILLLGAISSQVARFICRKNARIAEDEVDASDIAAIR